MLTLTRMMLALVLSFVLVEAPVVNSRAYGAMISTQSAVSDLTIERDKITNFMARSDVKAQLIKLGVSEQEANLRIASLSDKEVKKLSTEIDNATAGGDIVIGLGALLLIILIVWLIADDDDDDD